MRATSFLWRGGRTGFGWGAAGGDAGQAEQGTGAVTGSRPTRRSTGALFPTIRDSELVARIPRPRAIRAKVVCLLAVPIVSLMTLWGLAAVQTAQTVYSLTQLKQLNAAVGMPNDDLITALQHERIDAARFLGGRAAGGGRPDSALTADYAHTDTAADALRGGAGTAASGLGAQVAAPLGALLSDLSALPALRGEVARRQVTWATAQAGYTKAISDALGLDTGLSATLSKVDQNGQIASDAWAVTQLERSREMLARQAAIVTQAQSAGTPLDADSYRQFAGAYYSQHELEQAALAQLNAGDAAAYQRVTSSAAYQRLQGAQQAVLGAGDRDARSTAITQAQSAWSALAPEQLDLLADVIAGAGTKAVAQVSPYGRALQTKAGAGVLLGLLAVTASLLVSVWIGRALVMELVGLRDSAFDLARRRLPAAIARLRSGQEVDLEEEVGQGTLGVSNLTQAGSGGGIEVAAKADGSAGGGEIGQVAAALASVHRAALRAALDRAEAVNGVAGVFLNLARRSQVLLHRQLALLDLMERRIEEPADLEDLFRLDHLATRMRRHAEGLIILSGASPGRSWRRPVPVMDVVRAAVAEVEDYARVDVRQMPDARIAGAAIADLTHLLAELVENATAFSPPHTRVHIQGARVAAGYALEIEDRGLGMGPEALADANRRIQSERPDDLLGTDRLGLFVVSRLARRHGVRAVLQPSAYGGTTAVVLLPTALLREPEQEPATGTRPTVVGARQGSAGRGEETTGRATTAPGRANAPTGTGPTGTAPAGTAPAGSAAHGPTLNPAPSAGPASPDPAGARAGSGTFEPRFAGSDGLLDTSARSGIDADGVAQADPAVLRASTGPETPGGLPRRVKQASLAPGLRIGPARTASPPDPDEDPKPRSPDQARATMAAYQQGWSRGRGGTEPASGPLFMSGPPSAASSSPSASTAPSAGSAPSLSTAPSAVSPPTASTAPPADD